MAKWTSIGIDNGLDGALVSLDGETGTLLGYRDCPFIMTGKGNRRVFDIPGMVTALRDLMGMHLLRVFVEKTQSTPKIGGIPAHMLGLGAGVWLGILAALGISYQVVHPRTWQSSMLKGTIGEGKQRSLIAASQAFPDLPLIKPKGRKLSLDGRADAAWIAEWGRRQVLGEW